jgi:arginine deiminase
MSTTEDQIADNFNKPLPKASFTRDQEIYWGDMT